MRTLGFVPTEGKQLANRRSWGFNSVNSARGLSRRASRYSKTCPGPQGLPCPRAGLPSSARELAAPLLIPARLRDPAEPPARAEPGGGGAREKVRPRDWAARSPQGPSGAFPRFSPACFTWCQAAPLLGRSRRKGLWCNLSERLEMSERSSAVGEEQAGSSIPGLGELPTHQERLCGLRPKPKEDLGEPGDLDTLGGATSSL